MTSQKRSKSKVGRKPKITTQTLGKLKEAFLLGCTDVEACFYADIHPDTLYEYQNKNHKYSESKEAYKSYPIFLARKTVINGIKTDAHLAIKYLERKKADEFSTKIAIEGSIPKGIIAGFNYIVPEKPNNES